MAKKTKKSAENITAQTAVPAVETTPTVTPKLIVAQRKFNRWYVYFKGVAPKDNVGCITDCTCEMHNGDEKLNICEPLYKH